MNSAAIVTVLLHISHKRHIIRISQITD